MVGTNIINVTFFGVFGDLPALIPDNSALINDAAGGSPGSGTITIASDGGSINGIRSVEGSRENDVCSNRGLCDVTTGQCECFLGFSSSDGKGNEGALGECGYRVPARTTYTSTT